MNIFYFCYEERKLFLNSAVFKITCQDTVLIILNSAVFKVTCQDTVLIFDRLLSVLYTHFHMEDITLNTFSTQLSLDHVISHWIPLGSL